MLYSTHKLGNDFSGHIGENALTNYLNLQYDVIAEIQADGDELKQCCDILGRRKPSVRVYTFLGNNAKEIAMNWTT